MTHRILVVDDEAHIVQVLSLKLRNAGYEVLNACDGEEGLELALRHRPDLIITDFQMPYMTGLEMCRELSRHANTASIPVLMLTARGYALDANDLAMLHAPADGPDATRGCLHTIRQVLSKPFSPRALLEEVQSILDPNRAVAGENDKAQAA
jgi:two-component system, OmpR family, alkaline phosphatase synthesis response regulator PhoP